MGKIELMREFGKLTEEGFFKGQLASYCVLKYYIENLWTVDASSRYPDAKKMHVMRGMIWPAVVCENVPVSRSTVQRSNKWLEKQGIIKIERASPRGGKEMPVDIEVIFEGRSLANRVHNHAYYNPNRHHDDSKPHCAAHKENRKETSHGVDPAENDQAPILAQSTSTASGSVPKPPRTQSSSCGLGTVPYWRSRKGKFRKAGKSKARPGETLVHLTEDEIERYTDD